MSRALCILAIMSLLYSCYPSYSLQSAKALEKGKVSGSIGMSAPLPFPALAIRLGMGQNIEIGAKSTLISNEIGLKYALKEEQSESYQHAFGLTIGNTFLEEDIIDDFHYDVNNEGDSILTQSTVEFDVAVITLPYYMSLHNKKDFLRLYGKLAPTFSKGRSFNSFGIITSTGVSIGKKVSINAELFSHIPLSNQTRFHNNQNNLNTLPLYNIGVQLGIVIGQF